MKGTLYTISFILSLLLTFSCEKEEIEGPLGSSEIETRPGLEEEEIETYLGEVGIYISTRDIARKGYLPTFAEVTISGNTFDTTGTIPIDAYTNRTYISKKIEELSEAQLVELQDNGVDISIKVYDNTNDLLSESTESGIYLTSSPQTLEVPSDLDDVVSSTIAIRPGVTHHLQTIDRSSNTVQYAPGVSSWSNALNDDSYVYNLSDLNYSEENTFIHSGYQFEERGTSGEYTIAWHRSNSDSVFYLYVEEDGNNRLKIENRYTQQINGGNSTPQADKFLFTIEPVEPGMYVIRSVLTGNPLTLIDHYNDVTLGKRNLSAEVSNPLDEDIVYFRLVCLDIDWEFIPTSYHQLTPILPPARTEFAFNSTLVNCSNGDLEQTVGRDETRETTFTSTWEESMSMSVSTSYSISMTTESEVSANFYGASASVSQSVNQEFSVGVDIGSTSTQGGSNSTSRSVTISAQRSIMVPPGSATRVTDVYQTYSNIEIPYVQQFQIKGEFRGGQGALTAEEIITQLNFNSFGGVVARVEENYVLVTVRGTTIVDELIEAKTIADDVPPECD